jgi:hypothetical protein
MTTASDDPFMKFSCRKWTPRYAFLRLGNWREVVGGRAFAGRSAVVDVTLCFVACFGMCSVVVFVHAAL